MYCTNCGSRNSDDSKFCTNCGTPIAQANATSVGAGDDPPVMGEPPEPVHVPNYLVQAILVTIFCCLPLGIVSIVFAAQVNGHVAAGDIPNARRASNLAKTWAWVAFIGGLVIVFSWVALVFLTGIFTELSNELGDL